MAPPPKPVDEGVGDDELDAILAEEDVDVDDSDALNMFLGDGLALALASGKKLGDSKEYVAHADDAIDYEDEDELADEEHEDSVTNDVEEEKDGETDEDDWAKEFSEDLKIKKEIQSDEDEDEGKTSQEMLSTRASLAPQYSISTAADSSFSSSTPSVSGQPSEPVFGGYPLQDHSQMEEIEPSHGELEQHVLPEEDIAATAMLFQDMMPTEESRPLRMSALFAPEPVRLSLPKPHSVKPCIPTRVNLDADKDQQKLFRSHTRPRGSIYEKPGVVQIRNKDASNRKRIKQQKERNLTQFEKQLIFSCYDWESKIIWDSDASIDRNLESAHKKVRIVAPSVDDIYWVDDDEYVSGVGDDAILEGNLEEQANRVVLDLNDVQLMVDSRRADRQKKPSKSMAIGEQLFQKRYNISNDQAYDLLKENYRSRVRSTIGNLTIDHSMVANRLQSPYYKVKLSKSQARSFHRPNFVIRPNSVIHFSRVRHRKKKKDKGKDIAQIFATSKDLSLGDGSHYVMLEYSEEYPAVMSNFGMGSKIINYYRKKSTEDDSRPKLNIGETYVLGSQDRSPFWNFGFVEPGEIVPTYYNRLVRAPIFKQQVNKTDFLMIRSTGGGEGQKYYLRSIPNLYTVGQTLPVTEVPSPRSRRVTTASKNRLKMVVFRVLHKSENERILVKGISSHFPDQNDMQNRQRLKEFMEYQRAGEDQGYWKIKATDTLPNEDGIRSMVNPEEVTLLETMQVGQQFLADAGYGGGKEDDEQHEGMSTEEKLAPWITSKNFINATQGKAMLELHGDGDPSGCGLAFSFIRTSMKGGFKAMGEPTDEKVDKSKYGGHSYNVALQQKAYEEEIARIWAAQKKDLTAPAAPADS
ncbi:hypothetical protein V1525DRAFT_456632 [Lipomyces kononenkoae]|uniref:Uncharacterized protein n=1 Tax=Lipomyces kononenkoae TaxID=34357 RepID=A0ACC3T224_LIPKO